MTTVFHAWPYGKFIEIQSHLRRKKFHRTSQGSNFLEGTFSNRDNVRAPIQFRRESLKCKYLKKNLSLRLFSCDTFLNTNKIWSVTAYFNGYTGQICLRLSLYFRYIKKLLQSKKVT